MLVTRYTRLSQLLVGALALIVLMPSAASADDGLGGFDANSATAVLGGLQAPAGLDQFSFLTSSSGPEVSASSLGWDLVQSGYSLSQVDPLTGALMADSPQHALSRGIADEQDILASNDLAFNAAQLAAQARAEELAKEKAAQLAAQKAAAANAAANAASGVAQPWQLKNFTTCGNPGNANFQARTELVDAFTNMCQAAAQAGVSLQIQGAFRTPAQQANVFAAAVKHYGSEAEARRWVSYSDGTTCDSQHCTGLGIDVNQDGAAGSWLHHPVGCLSGGHITSSSCNGDSSPVVQAQRYGFVFPVGYEPWYLQFALPTGTSTSSCSPPSNTTIPQMIGDIFRCRLAAAGITGDDQRNVVAQALTVSRCESSWNAAVVVDGGRYQYTPNPATGYRETAAGVFQFLDTTANAYVSGGYANVFNPVANINGAASLYLEGRKTHPTTAWSPWACASLIDGRMSHSVLPGYPGGPASLPSWAYQY